MMHDAQLNNKTIWLIGASSGIGLGLVHELARQKNFIFISARNVEALSQIKQEFSENIRVLPMDLTDLSSMASAEKRLYELTDQLDTLLICSGICEYDDGPHLNAESYQRITHTNYLGVVEAVRIALPLLRRSASRAKIVALSSLASLVPFPRAAAYGASKAALEYFLLSMNTQLREQNIDVVVIRPGFVDTPLTKRNDFSMPMLMSVDEAVNKIIQELNRGKHFIDFPIALTIPLRLARMFPQLWLKYCAPKLRKPKRI